MVDQKAPVDLDEVFAELERTAAEDQAQIQRLRQALGGPAEYLRLFFSELKGLKCGSIGDTSHAIGFHGGKLYILIGIGDFRERVYIQDLDKDPSCAAQDVYLLWRTTPGVNEEIEYED